MLNIANKTVREIALEAPVTTRVFEEFKIDYCCGGRRSIADACTAAGVDPAILTQRLIDAADRSKSNGEVHAESLPPTALIGHIVSTHHAFTLSEVNRLGPLMAKVAAKHGSHYPQLVELERLFTDLAESLLPHMQKEEVVLFPYIQRLEASENLGLAAAVPPFGTVKNPIRMLMNEHDTDGDRLAEMRRITNDYDLPADACPSFTGLYAGLEELERDLHRHIHLENNVLFPAAALLEEANATN